VQFEFTVEGGVLVVMRNTNLDELLEELEGGLVLNEIGPDGSGYVSQAEDRCLERIRVLTLRDGVVEEGCNEVLAIGRKLFLKV
jgi:hypothetical protein